MSASPARVIAFRILCRVESEGAYAADLLHAQLTRGAARSDAALATELTMGVLRWKRLLDFLLSRHLDREAERLDPEVLLALRLGLYQLRFLDRVPARAAVNECVELVKTARKRSAAALVNAVLRSIAGESKAADGKLEAMLPASASEAERMGILHSHPTWMVERWIGTFGALRTKALLEWNNHPPRLTCTIHDTSRTSEVGESLRRQGFEVRPGRWLNTAVAISGGNPAQSTALQAGQISLQDEASQMAARLVEARSGNIVLDLCAAPGGKTGILARMVGAGGIVIAGDIHEHRLRSARDQCKRAHVENIRWLALDSTQPLPFARQFQRILLDAPCSGTGTLARNPEIRWRLQPDHLSGAHCRQTAMLRRALAQLDAGGRLVYATCSLEPEENEHAVHRALQQEANVRVVRGEEALRPWLRSDIHAADLFDEQGFFRTFPPESGTDGFFAAVLERYK